MEYRGLWFSFLDFPMLHFQSETAFRDSLKQILERCAAKAINRFIFHVHPCSDALYNSKHFPWSHLITGEQGKTPKYDPLEILTQEADAYDIGVDAWLNPFRVSGGSFPKSILCNGHIALRRPELLLNVNGNLYLNPARQEVTDLLRDETADLAKRYRLAAVQFDDYFYPTTDLSCDESDYLSSKTDLSHSDWRRNNINLFVRAIRQAVHESRLPFGISPHGNNIKNYAQQFADVELWMREEGYTDFVIPQLYYGFKPFTEEGVLVSFDRGEASVNAWLNRKKIKSQKVYYGLPAFLADDAQQNGFDSMEDFFLYLKKANADGYAVFRAESWLNR